ncbi:MAG: GTP 3',8-cyclase MoaA [Planctomycetales bacterium]|nr:GTP 3',8-cyclase MoaA [Planctomycetales bacterium]NIM08274.1 GTP 3',8-cyclase MoaA [Planctomycetales bacterium]NIN07767.1 GTP 3',8-cyclase MoaA [Planctomycetales bacterium]NIN76887.1 GTP 3',8-cyclase MoaA [Planctomycetales bacterium]NIO34086.1 GTP 3',8-cyclase MoaA [Planctomycetales bacterium]
MPPPPLIDRFGRPHTSLRLSVTDRCNIRCLYCMPAADVQFVPRAELLTFEEIHRVVRVAAGLGICKVRVTGGEPLVRHGLPQLIRNLDQIDQLTDLALTTNGLLLAEQAESLRQAGLRRLNISLDTLEEATFEKISLRPGLDRVLEGIFAARRAGFDEIRLNALALHGLNEKDIVPLGQFARQHQLELRFIEFMPLDAAGQWHSGQVLYGATVRRRLEKAFGPLLPCPRKDPSQPAVDYQFADGKGQIGFICSVSEPFCDRCNRLRLTAEGQIRNCLFGNAEWDARTLLRGGADDWQLADLFRSAVAAKKAGHGIDTEDFVRPQRAMYQIGG